MRRAQLLAGAMLVLAPRTPLAAQAPAHRVPPAIASIRQPEISRDLYTMAGDSMRGRESGTLDEMRASMWVAAAMEKIGVKPSGNDGSWFQWWNMHRTSRSS